MEAFTGDIGYMYDTGFRRGNTATAPVSSLSSAPASAPLMPQQAAAAAAMNSTSGAIGEWKAWDDAAFDSLNFELDLGFDTFLLATADDFMEPFAAIAAQTAAPSSPQMFSDHSCPSESEASVADEEALMSPVVVEAPVKRSRKRKNPETVLQQQQQMMMMAKPVVVTKSQNDKKTKVSHQKNKVVHAPISAEAERLYRRRYDILHEILEAWNTGGIEDMEEIADDVYDSEVMMVSPDYSEGLKGVQALMHHWTLLLDSFPDGIMEEYNIERDDAEGQKMNVTWVFSGTQIFPFFGVEPRHEKVTIRGNSFFSFKGDKISKMVLSWNYREALMQLMGVKPNKIPVERR